MVLSYQKYSQLKSVSSNKVNPECQTAESMVEERRSLKNATQVNYYQDSVYPERQYISKQQQLYSLSYDQSLQKQSYFQENSNVKQDNDTIDDIFRLSQTDQSQSYQSKTFYDSLAFAQNQQLDNQEKQRYPSTPSTHNFEKYQEKQIKQSLIQIDERLKEIQGQQVNSTNKKQYHQPQSIQLLNSDKAQRQKNKEQGKTFDQYYQEYVEDEISNIHHEISEMQKFLNRIQTAKDRLSSSVQDLSYQGSQRSMQKLNQELDIIQTLRNNMQIQLQNHVDGDKIQRLRAMKTQIEGCFNDLEEELIKFSK